MIAAVRIRGRSNLRSTINDTMVMLNMKTTNNCIVVPETDTYMRMLQKSKDYLTFGQVSKEVFEKLILKWGRTVKNEKVTTEYLKSKNYTAGKLFEDLENQKIKLQKLDIKPVFRLHPPRKGFKSVKRPYAMKGDLGNRNDKMNELLERMI